MCGARDSVGARFAVAVTALFGFLRRDGVAVAATAALGGHEELFGAEVVDFGLWSNQYEILTISVMACGSQILEGN